MAKELPNTNAPPDVFQMFNANRTYYFESDISSLPHLPCTLPAPVPPSPPKLHKSFSQPQLHCTSTSSGNPTVASGSSAPLHLAAILPIPSAIMASTSQRYPFFKHTSSEELNINSLESRYQTEPSYSSSHILKSFHQEFREFDHNNRKSHSAPSSPRLLRPSLKDLEQPSLREVRPHTKSDPRKLSLVKEETEEMKNEMLAVSAKHRFKDEEVKSQSKPPLVMSSVPGDHVDGEMLKGNNLPLTKQMMNWFTTPQKQISVNRTELNAMSPTSF